MTLSTVNDPEPNFYGGVARDWELICFDSHFGPLGVLIGLIDLPFSFVGDTLTLPVHAIRSSRGGKKEKVPAGKVNSTNLPQTDHATKNGEDRSRAEASYPLIGYRRIKNPRISSLHDLAVLTELRG